MNFEYFIKNRKVKKGEKDVQKAKALVKMSNQGILTADRFDLDAISSSSVFGIYYESLREIVEAVSVLEGFKVYSHEAFTAYLKKIDEMRIAEMFDKFRKLRNGANYYGESIKKETTETARVEIKKLVKELKDKYLNNLK